MTMHTLNSQWCCFVLTVLLGGQAAAVCGAAKDSPPKTSPERWEAPSALVLDPAGAELYVACAKTDHVLVLETAGLQVKRTIAVPGSPSGLALSADGRTLYVTCAAPVSQLVTIDAAQGKTLGSVPVGHTALSPVLSPDGATVYVCNRFNNDVSVIDTRSGKETGRIPVEREPVSAAVTPDGKYLLVANHLHQGRADADRVAAKVSIIDTAKRQVVRELQLPNGSGMLRDVRVSPDGRYACVAHVLARFQLPTTQLERGWMNTSALTLIDLSALAIVNTVLLDNVDSGAADPWAAGWSADGKTIFVTHAGTHELSVINFPALLEKLAKLPDQPDSRSPVDYSVVSRVKADVPSDLAFLVGLRERLKLAGKGPRAAVMREARVYVANYFSGTIEAIDLRPGLPAKRLEARLEPDRPMSILRQGEFRFNDASICFQGWQSCATCHSEDARVDGLNWDLLNDGIGNPKNNKSLLWSHRTPPAMSMGVRETAESAVRSGIRNILFTVQPEEVAVAMDEWLKSLEPVPSPSLVNGKLSAEARRGEKVFKSPETHCATCHPTGLFSDLKHHDVGTLAATDKPDDRFDTPTLVEIWRTGPYLHDGSALSVREVLVEHNRQDRHGKTSHLSKGQIDDLVAYLLSL